MNDNSLDTVRLATGELPDNITNDTNDTNGIVLPTKPTIQTFYKLIEAHFGANERNNNKSMMRFNTMAYRWEIFDVRSKAWREWTDADESRFRAYFQKTYGVYSPKMLTDALVVWFDEHKVNPLIEILDNLQWDGQPRIERFLTKVMKADDTPYVRECSRLIFAGGVHRAYNPGCKFDDMPVLVGDQGGGKSTCVRWLNMDDRFSGEIKTIKGKEGIEAIQGLWIVEVVELMAMVNTKEVEAVKAYLSSDSDRYRPPYGKNVITLPRRCCFIGTTNNWNFLTDKTGNRRFYPVICKIRPYELYNNEKTVKDYITQAWAEAVHRYKNNQLPPYANPELLDDIRTAQTDAMEDDWRVGAIEQYLQEEKGKSGDMVCVIELWHEALRQDINSKPSRKDSVEITQIMTGFKEWNRQSTPEYTKWGRQKVFKRIF